MVHNLILIIVMQMQVKRRGLMFWIQERQKKHLTLVKFWRLELSSRKVDPKYWQGKERSLRRIKVKLVMQKVYWSKVMGYQDSIQVKTTKRRKQELLQSHQNIIQKPLPNVSNIFSSFIRQWPRRTITPSREPSIWNRSFSEEGNENIVLSYEKA